MSQSPKHGIKSLACIWLVFDMHWACIGYALGMRMIWYPYDMI